MGNPQKDFFIFTAPRSGSTVLTRTLDKHPQIFCAGELFHPSDKIYHPEWHFPFIGRKKKKGLSRKIFAATNYIKGRLSGVNHINKFYSKRDNKKVRGFKLMIGHTKDFPSVWQYLRTANLKVIVLIRQNTFREALSSFRARKIGVFHSSTDESLAITKVNIDAVGLKKRVDELEILKSSILKKSEGTDRIIISYEDFENWQPMLNKIFEFLNVDKIDIEPELRKVSDANWRNGVENFQEVENIMREQYAHFLD
ncbi:MAG: sulfotransferase [Bacteroidetes bacterium]|nr:sulfotransferase [Bacteroidota bacterium]